MTTVKQAIIEVLQAAGKPMHVKEITERVLLLTSDLKGKTPQHTVNAVLSTDSRFNRVFTKGVYALSEWQEYKEFRKVVDIAYDILLDGRRPLSVAEIANRVVNERHLGSSPSSTVHQLLQNDPRFEQLSPDLFQLVQSRRGKVSG